MIPTSLFPAWPCICSLSPGRLTMGELFLNAGEPRKQALSCGPGIRLLSLSENNSRIFQLRVYKWSLSFIQFLTTASWIAQFVTSLCCELPLYSWAELTVRYMSLLVSVQFSGLCILKTFLKYLKGITVFRNVHIIWLFFLIVAGKVYHFKINGTSFVVFPFLLSLLLSNET